jgi:uncharacterized protein (TIGR00297 family)
MSFEAAFIGLAASSVIAWQAWRRGSLSGSGAVGAVVVGTLVFAGGGPGWAMLLLAFYGTSTMLSRIGRRRKEALAGRLEKGGTAVGPRRDLVQVLANGGVPAALALVHTLHPSALWPLAAAGALAAANADTWATEIGVLGPPPRSILNGRRAATGESGAVSLLGTAAALGGAALIAGVALAAASVGALPPLPVTGGLVVSVTVGGLAGAVADSLLGASLQAAYRCPTCGTATERRRHTCGAVTQRVGGVPWLNNDGVNLAGSAVGAVVALLAGTGWAT